MLNWRLRFGLGSAILIVIILGLTSWRAIVLFDESDEWVRHTHDVIENLDDLEIAMGVFESSSRGFILTGAESYMASFDAGMQAVERSEAIVRHLTVDNPVQQRRLPLLEEVAARKIESGKTATNLRRARGMQVTAISASWAFRMRSFEKPDRPDAAEWRALKLHPFFTHGRFSSASWIRVHERNSAFAPRKAGRVRRLSRLTETQMPLEARFWWSRHLRCTGANRPYRDAMTPDGVFRLMRRVPPMPSTPVVSRRLSNPVRTATRPLSL